MPRKVRKPTAAPLRPVTTEPWSLGGTNAEADPLLDDAFVDNGSYSRLLSQGDAHWFVVGRTGSGKSAVIRQLEQQHPNQVTRIDPRELAFQHITNLNAIRVLLSLNVRLEPFFHALWRHLILCQVIRHRYENPTEESTRGLFNRLRERLRRTPTAAGHRTEYVDELERDFWDTAEEQVRHQVDKLVTKVDAAVNAGVTTPGISLGGTASGQRLTSSESQAELKDRFQRIVNDDVVVRLNSVVRLLADEALKSEQHFTYVVVDDLDLTWIEDDVANLLIKCLLQVALDLQRTRYLKIIIALRINIFEQLNVGSQARGGQEEKLREAAMVLRWSRSDLESVVVKRLAADAKRHNTSPPPDLLTILPRARRDGVDPFSHIINRTLMRPRDVILYFNRCLEQCASGRPKITWNIIREVEPAYSRDRLTALRDEWNDPFYDIERVLWCFRGRPWAFGLTLLGEVCDDIALLLVEGEDQRRRGITPFRGSHWLTPLCAPLWEPGALRIPWRERYGPLLSVLFDLGFLGCAPRPRQDAVYGTDPLADLRDLLGGLPDEDVEFSIHPAFRSALEMTTPRGRARRI